MEVLQSNLFKTSYKKLHKKHLVMVNQEIRTIIADPNIGEAKKGDLLGIRVHKFKIDTQLYLLAYEYKDNVARLLLLALGSHENFYDKVKKFIK